MILSVGGVAMLAIFLYLLIWEPITNDRERLLRDLPKLRAQGLEFRKNADEANALKSRLKSRGTSQAMPAVVEASARQANLGAPLKSVQTLGNDRVQVSGSELQFDAFVRWLGTLATSDGIGVDTVQATVDSKPGRIQLDKLVLRR